MKLKQALELALAQLGPFAESSLYADYQREDGFTDAQWDEMMEKLRSLASMGESVLDRARKPTRCSSCGRAGSEMVVGEVCNACGFCKGRMEEVS